MDDSLLTTPPGRERLEAEILPLWLPRQRWFGGKAREILACQITRQAAFDPAWIFAVEVTYTSGAPETYLVPLVVSDDAEEALVPLSEGRWLQEATHDPEFRANLFRLMAADALRSGLKGSAGAYLRSTFEAGLPPDSRVLKAEQSNTSIIYGEKLFLKLYRKLVSGLNPDAEITRHLSDQAGFSQVPAFGGSIEWEGCSMALATAMVEHQGDAWQWAVGLAERDFQKLVSTGGGEAYFAFLQANARAEEVALGPRQLGRRTGEMHVCLARGETEAFRAVPWQMGDYRTLADGIRSSAAEMCAGLDAQAGLLPENCGPLLAVLRSSLPSWQRLADEIAALPVEGVKIRTHGDYHLGQVLLVNGDFVILDFEGEPSRTLEERRAKRSPLRDVAGMLRSFHYAAHFASRKCGCESAGLQSWVEGKAWSWQGQFLQGWMSAVEGTPIAPSGSQVSRRLLHALAVEKALYEVRYELNNRPDWVEIPLRGLAAALRENESPGALLKDYPTTTA